MTSHLFFFFWGIMMTQLTFSAKAARRQPTELLGNKGDRSEIARTLAYSMRLGKIDYMLENMNRRVETIESKLSHFEARLDVRMEKIEEAVLAKDLKGEFATDQLSRQINTLGEKVMNKLAFIEAKMSMKIDNLNSRFERGERNLRHSLERLGSKFTNADDTHGQVQSESRMWTDLGQVEEINNSIQDLKSFITEEIAGTVIKKLHDIGEKVDTGFQGLDNEMEVGQSAISDLKTAVVTSNNLTKETVKLLEAKMNTSCERDNNRGRSAVLQIQRESVESDSEDINILATKAHEQLDNITNVMSEALRIGEQKFKELDSDVEIYTKKVLNVYYELLKGSREIEQYLVTTLAQGNQTRLAVQDGFRRIYHQLRPLTALEPKIEELVEGLEVKILDLSTTVDSNFAALLVAQNAFIASCHRIRDEEPQIESRIYDTVQKIVQHKTSGSANISSVVVEASHCRQEHILSDLLWTMFSIGNQTRDNFTTLTAQVASLHKAVVNANNAHSKCMIGDGDWSSLSKACGFMYGRVAAAPKQEPNSNMFSSTPLGNGGTKERQSLTVNGHLPDTNSSSARFLSSQQERQMISQQTQPRSNQKMPDNFSSRHQNFKDAQSSSTQKHSIRSSHLEDAVTTEENSNKGQQDYDYEDEYLDDYPDM